MPKNIEANTVASFVLSVIVIYLALVALYSTSLSIQSLSVNYQLCARAPISGGWLWSAEGRWHWQLQAPHRKCKDKSKGVPLS
jgi:hypothetical protein